MRYLIYRSFNKILICLLPSLFLLLGISMLPTVNTIYITVKSSEVFAQDKVLPSKKRKTRRTMAVRDRVYKKIGKTKEFIEAEMYKEAMVILDGLLADKSLNGYERAQALNYYAYIYYIQDKYKLSLGSYKEILQQEGIPEGMELSTLISMSQIYLMMEDFKNSVATMKNWFQISTIPTVQAYEIIAQGYYQLEDYKNSAKYAEKGRALLKKQGNIPKEQLYLILRAAYFEMDNIDKVIEISEELVVNYPKGDYFSTLASMYGEKGDESRQLAVLEAAYDSKLLSKQRDLVVLANLLVLNDVPHKAAIILEKGMKKDQIEESVSYLKLLGQSWQLAQEPQKSIIVLTKAAEKDESGDLYARIASSYLDLEDWNMAIASVKKAFKKGDIKAPGFAYVTLGMSLFNIDDYDGAIDAFTKAKNYKETKGYSRDWIKFLVREKEVQQRIRNSLQ